VPYGETPRFQGDKRRAVQFATTNATPVATRCRTMDSLVFGCRTVPWKMSGSRPIGAKTASRMARHRSLFVRLDRTIGGPKIALNGVFVLVVRSSRTMPMEAGTTPLVVLFWRL
jgi:hypothetical protein